MDTTEQKLQEIRTNAKIVFEIWKKFDKSLIPVDFQLYILNFHELVETTTDLSIIKSQRQLFNFYWIRTNKNALSQEEIDAVDQFNELIDTAV